MIIKLFHSILFILLSVKETTLQQPPHQRNNRTTTSVAVTSSTTPLSYKCLHSTDFECLNKQKCIRLSQVCDKVFDCTDRSDEFNCNFCNQTFINDESERFSVRSPINYNEKTFCYYKIVNTKNSTVIGVRLRKFNVGKLDPYTGQCEDAWLDIYEDDDYDSKLDNLFKKVIKNNRKGRKKVGRFCGTLYDMYSNYYAHSKVLHIVFYVVSTVETTTTDATSTKPGYEFDFEIVFHESKNLAIENSITTYRKSISSLANTSAAENPATFRKTFYTGVLIDGTQCNRLYNDCFRNNDNSSFACIINSPGFPGIYAKDLQCLFYVRKSAPNETFIIINSYLQIDSKVCLNKNLNRNQYKSYMCESRLVIGGEDCNDYLNIYNGPSTSDGVLAEKVCGNGYLPKIITKSDSFLFKFTSGSSGLFANTGFVFYILSEKQYFEFYDTFNRRIFNNNSISNVNELKSIQKIEKLQIGNCDSFKNFCLISLQDDEDSAGYLFSLNQYHMRNFTLKYVLKTSEFNSIGIFIENYFLLKCNQSYLAIESVEQDERNLIKMFCNSEQEEDGEGERSDERSVVKQKLFLIDNNYAKNIIITNYKLQQVFDALRMYDFKIYYEYFNLQWNIYVRNSICDYVINADNDTTLIRDHLVNPKADVFYKFNTLDCRYKLIAAKNQYIKLIVNEISFNNDNCNENMFLGNNETEYELEAKCSKINAKIMIKELDLYFASVAVRNESSTVLRACLCKKVNERKMFISQTNYVEILYSIKLSQFGSSNLKQNRFNITYKFMSRNCNSRVGALRGTFEFNSKYGVQKELLIQGYNRSLLYPMNALNMNYYCKFNIYTSKNSFVYAEIIDLQILSNDCELDYVKVFSIYKSPLMKLCTTKKLDENERNFSFLTLKKKQLLNDKNLIIDTQFMNENLKQKILSCYDNTRKLCFTSSDLIIHDTQRVYKLLDGVPNRLSFEILASNLSNFKFKLRYHFYTLDKHVVNKTYKNECEFKCSLSKTSFSPNNTFVNICLNKKLRCDGTVDCIYSDEDEHECPKFSQTVLITIILAAIFGFIALLLIVILLSRKFCTSAASRVQYRKAKLNKR